MENEKGDKTKYSIGYDRTRLMETIPWERRVPRVITPIPGEMELVQQNSPTNISNTQIIMRRASQQEIQPVEYALQAVETPMDSTEFWYVNFRTIVKFIQF